MYSEERTIVMRVIENYVRTGQLADAQVKVASVPFGKTSFTEQSGDDDSRIIMLDEYKVDDKVIWAAYSFRSSTVYLSLLSS